jgi:threonine dehydrogenase-like Zn-dependent dehydrogenase
VRGLKVGQTVAVEPGIACGRCRACRQDRTNLCYRMRFLGGPDCTGAFQRYLTMPAACFKPLPGGVDPALASAAEPLGVALHALKIVGLRRGESVGILGGGPIGLSVLALARATGAKIVAVSDLFECAGAPDAFDAAVAAAELGGRIALVGITPTEVLTVDPHAWRVRELQVVQVRRSNHTLPRVLSHLTRGDFGLRRAGFFSEMIGLGGLQTAFEQLAHDASPAVKIGVDPRL